jgi:hypothetical protein
VAAGRRNSLVIQYIYHLTALKLEVDTLTDFVATYFFKVLQSDHNKTSKKVKAGYVQYR